MRTIINRHIYDTETSLLICANGQLNVDGCTTCTELYKTQKFTFFLYVRTIRPYEQNVLYLCDDNIAMYFFETCGDTFVDWDVAFPDYPLTAG